MDKYSRISFSTNTPHFLAPINTPRPRRVPTSSCASFVLCLPALLETRKMSGNITKTDNHDPDQSPRKYKLVFIGEQGGKWAARSVEVMAPRPG